MDQQHQLHPSSTAPSMKNSKTGRKQQLVLLDPNGKLQLTRKQLATLPGDWKITEEEDEKEKAEEEDFGPSVEMETKVAAEGDESETAPHWPRLLEIIGTRRSATARHCPHFDRIISIEKVECPPISKRSSIQHLRSNEDALNQIMKDDNPMCSSTIEHVCFIGFVQTLLGQKLCMSFHFLSWKYSGNV